MAHGNRRRDEAAEPDEAAKGEGSPVPRFVREAVAPDPLSGGKRPGTPFGEPGEPPPATHPRPRDDAQGDHIGPVDPVDPVDPVGAADRPAAARPSGVAGEAAGVEHEPVLYEPSGTEPTEYEAIDRGPTEHEPVLYEPSGTEPTEYEAIDRGPMGTEPPGTADLRAEAPRIPPYITLGPAAIPTGQADVAPLSRKTGRSAMHPPPADEGEPFARGPRPTAGLARSPAEPAPSRSGSATSAEADDQPPGLVRLPVSDVTVADTWAMPVPGAGLDDTAWHDASHAEVVEWHDDPGDEDSEDPSGRARHLRAVPLSSTLPTIRVRVAAVVAAALVVAVGAAAALMLRDGGGDDEAARASRAAAGAPSTTAAPADSTTVVEPTTTTSTTTTEPTTTTTEAPTTTTTPAPTTSTPPPTTVPVYYADCDAARMAGATPLYRGDPGYRPELDRNGDGVACERPQGGG